LSEVKKIILPVEPYDQVIRSERLRQSLDEFAARLNSPWLRRMLNRLLATLEPTRSVVLRRPKNNPPLAGDCRALTFISANLWHDWPLHRLLPERLESFARLVEQQDADIILLQEVPRTDQVLADEWLTARLGMYSLYARANGEAQIGFEEGLAVFSRFPLRRPHLRRLQPGFLPFVHRLALAAQVDTPCGQLWAVSVHLALLHSQNRRQHASLHRFVERLGGDHPTVIGGDFNAHEDSLQIRRASANWLDTFRQANPHADGTTHSLRFPNGLTFHRRRLDYIFWRDASPGWQVIESRHLRAEEPAHSDHHLVLTRMALANFSQTPQQLNVTAPTT